MDAIDQFRTALAGRQILPPQEIVADGKIHRCDAEGKGGRGDAAYLLHLDGVPAGGFENHRDGLGWQNWRADIGRKLSPDEEREWQRRITAQRHQREQDEATRLSETKARAIAIWEASARTADAHPYLSHRSVGAHKVRIFGGELVIAGMDCAGALVVPMRNAAGELCQLQLIAPNGDKRYLPGPKPAGLYFSIGAPSQVVCVAEGFATGASIHEATRYAVAVAFDYGNLEPVARLIRGKFPSARIVLCADDDHTTRDNPGITKATAAARSISAALAIPDFGASRPDGATDFNDLARLRGNEAVKRCIDAASIPEPTTSFVGDEPMAGLWGRRCRGVRGTFSPRPR